MAAKDDFESLRDWAERLGLSEEEGENFITSSMRRLGHRARIDWDDAEESGGGGGGDFFARRQGREQRKVTGQRQPQRRASGGGGWQYEGE